MLIVFFVYFVVCSEAPDNWRPPLWHTGYETSGSTFRMIRRVLRLRKQLDGMHKFRQRTLHADHDVLVFARGPLTFVVGNVPSGKRSRAQRVVWNNATQGCNAEHVCDAPIIYIYIYIYVYIYI